MKLDKFLKSKKYRILSWKLTKTNHIVVKAKINGVKGRFILDTGASNSCIDFNDAQKFNLIVKDSETKAAGAGAIDLQTQISNDNILKIGEINLLDFQLVLMDLSHVNTALTQHKAKSVDGIIGADLLLETKALIDYKKRLLFLKR